MSRPRLLDLFCCQGGAGAGYVRAGFEVTGVDVAPQPRYPFAFVQADAIGYLREHGHDYDVVHASPPCQAHVNLAAKDGRHADLIPATRAVLRELGRPYVIENVEGSGLDGVKLCGSTFGLGVRRHRLFESNVLILGQGCAHGLQSSIRGYYGGHGGGNVQKAGRPPLDRGTVGHGAADMGIDWMTWEGLAEAIPPAYTQFIGEQLLAHLPIAVAA